MASKHDIDQAIYQFKSNFSNNQKFDIEVDPEYIIITRSYMEDRQINNKQKTIDEVINDE